MTKRQTRIIKSRKERRETPASTEYKTRYLYKVRAEAQLDILWAFWALKEEGYSYRPKDSDDGVILFGTNCPIGELREIWNELGKDLHIMVESLNFAEDYTGDRYYTKCDDDVYDTDAEEDEDDCACSKCK